MSGQSLPEMRKIALELSISTERTGPGETPLAPTRANNPLTALVGNFGQGVRPESKAVTNNQSSTSFKPNGKDASLASLNGIFDFMDGNEEMFG